ncbi:unnamed protein product, partial [Prunus brigantina]
VEENDNVLVLSEERMREKEIEESGVKYVRMTRRIGWGALCSGFMGAVLVMGNGGRGNRWGEIEFFYIYLFIYL